MVQALLATTRARGIPPTALRTGGQVGQEERLATGVLAAALVFLGYRRGGPLGFLALLGGAALGARAVSGYCPVYDAAGVNPLEEEVARRLGWESAVAVSRSITINRPRQEVYAFWRDFQNLPKFMGRVESVRPSGDSHFHWVWHGPEGREEGPVRIIEEEDGRRISWQSGDGSSFRTSGTVQFADAPGDRGTEVTLMTAFEPHGGAAMRAANLLWQRSPQRQAHVDLRRLKQLLETGEVATSAMRKAERPSAHA